MVHQRMIKSVVMWLHILVVSLWMCVCRNINKNTTNIQDVPREIREGVPYIKVYRYNPKRLCPKLNAKGDNGQREV